MNTLAKAAAGILALGGAAFIPAIPEDMSLLYSYQYAVNQPTEVRVGSTTVAAPVTRPAEFVDEDGNGLVSVAVFANREGEKVEAQIPDERYAEMGQAGGFAKNPARTELVSAYEALVEPTPVEAAIAYDNSTTGSTGAAATSLTYSHTTAGSDRFLLVSFVKHGTCDISYTHSVTYNGTSMTLVGSGVYPPCPAVAMMHTYRLTAPASGANNVVVTTSGANQTIHSAALSYTGVDQSSPVDNSAVYNPAQSNTISTSLTVNTANSWVVSGPLSFNTTNTEMTVLGVLTQRRGCITDGVCWGDSNGPLTTGSKTVSWDRSSAGNTLSTMTNFSLRESVPALPVRIIIFE